MTEFSHSQLNRDECSILHNYADYSAKLTANAHVQYTAVVANRYNITGLSQSQMYITCCVVCQTMCIAVAGHHVLSSVVHGELPQ